MQPRWDNHAELVVAGWRQRQADSSEEYARVVDLGAISNSCNQ
jgi:hypothetical protein